MTIPDPGTFIGNKCRIKLKTRHTVIRRILVIDPKGVTVEEEKGTKVYPFSEIAQVSLAAR